MWCKDLTECLTAKDNGALEAVKEAEQRCFQVKCGHNTYTCILHVCTIAARLASKTSFHMQSHVIR